MSDAAEAQIYTALSGNTPVTDVVYERIYPDFLSEEIELPAIVTQRAGTNFINTIHGGAPVASDAEMDSWCLGATRLEAEQLADLVIVALAAAGFLVTDRKQEFDPEVTTYAAIITCEIQEL